MQNTSICEMINIGDLKYSCLATVKKDESFCKNISRETGENLCYSDVSFAKEDPLICDKIPKYEDMRIKNQCFKNIAVLKKDPDLCCKIQPDQADIYNYDKITCLSGAKQDPSVCDNLPSEKVLQWMKEDCVKEASKSVMN